MHRHLRIQPQSAIRSTAHQIEIVPDIRLGNAIIPALASDFREPVSCNMTDLKINHASQVMLEALWAGACMLDTTSGFGPWRQRLAAQSKKLLPCQHSHWHGWPQSPTHSASGTTKLLESLSDILANHQSMKQSLTCGYTKILSSQRYDCTPRHELRQTMQFLLQDHHLRKRWCRRASRA